MGPIQKTTHFGSHFEIGVKKKAPPLDNANIPPSHSDSFNLKGRVHLESSPEFFEEHSKRIYTELEEILVDLKQWEKEYKIFNANFEKYKNRLNFPLKQIKSQNEYSDQINIILNEILPENQSTAILEEFERLYNVAKPIKPSANLILDSVKYHLLSRKKTNIEKIDERINQWAAASKALGIPISAEELQKRSSDLQKKLTEASKALGIPISAEELQRRSSDLQKKLKDDQKAAEASIHKMGFKLGKVSICDFAPFAIKRIVSIPNLKTEKIRRIFKSAFDIWKDFQGLQKLSDFSQDLEKLKAETQKTVQNSDQAKELLDKRRLDFEEKVDHAKSHIDRLLIECRPKSFNEIKDFLAKNHIHAENVPSFPDNHHDYLLAIRDEKFKSKLAREWVQHQETLSSLNEQGAKCLLLQKIKQERSFIPWQQAEYGLSLFSTVAYAAYSIFTFSAFRTIKKILRILNFNFIDIPHKGVGFTILILPDLNANMLELGIMAFSLGWGIVKKPHFHSMEGYKLTASLKWTELNFFIKHYCLHLKKLRYNISQELLNKIAYKILKQLTHKSKEEDILLNPHYVNLCQRIQENIENYEIEKSRLENKLKKLNLYDFQHFLNSEHGHVKEHSFQYFLRSEHSNFKEVDSELRKIKKLLASHDLLEKERPKKKNAALQKLHDLKYYSKVAYDNDLISTEKYQKIALVLLKGKYTYEHRKDNAVNTLTDSLSKSNLRFMNRSSEKLFLDHFGISLTKEHFQTNEENIKGFFSLYSYELADKLSERFKPKTAPSA